MDPLCHTLVGATLAQAGLKRRTPLATATLLIGANLPDVDAVTYFLGESLFWRRGWTHGILAIAVWPFVLTGVMLVWHRIVRARAATPRPPPPIRRELLQLAVLAVLTHSLLDYMNNYGLRWLMPFVDRWFYGDALYIVDPWVWGMLGSGAGVSFLLHRSGNRAWAAPARIALVLVLSYMAVMLTLGQTGRSLVAGQLDQRGIRLARPPMVAPILVHPLQRYVVADMGDRYLVALFRWWPSPMLERFARVIPYGDQHPAIAAARQAPEARGFLRWARFPFYTVMDSGDAYLVTMDDARYAPAVGTSWAAMRVRVPKQQARQ